MFEAFVMMVAMVEVANVRSLWIFHKEVDRLDPPIHTYEKSLQPRKLYYIESPIWYSTLVLHYWFSFDSNSFINTAILPGRFTSSINSCFIVASDSSSQSHLCVFSFLQTAALVFG